MKKHSFFSIGPGAPSLILIIVILALTILSVLCLISARNEARLSERNIEVAEMNYALNDMAEHTLAGLDKILFEAEQSAADDSTYLSDIEDALPEGMSMAGNTVLWFEELNGRRLECSVRVCALNEDCRWKWNSHRLIVDEGMDEEWN